MNRGGASNRKRSHKKRKRREYQTSQCLHVWTSRHGGISGARVSKLGRREGGDKTLPIHENVETPKKTVKGRRTGRLNTKSDKAPRAPRIKQIKCGQGSHSFSTLNRWGSRREGKGGVTPREKGTSHVHRKKIEDANNLHVDRGSRYGITVRIEGT